MLDNKRCILMVRGELPVYDFKYKATKHPRFNETGKAGAALYEHINKRKMEEQRLQEETLLFKRISLEEYFEEYGIDDLEFIE